MSQNMNFNENLARIEAKLMQLLQKMRTLKRENAALNQENQQLRQLLEQKNALIQELENEKVAAKQAPAVRTAKTLEPISANHAAREHQPIRETPAPKAESSAVENLA
jgi:regulator of replication initiation timing